MCVGDVRERERARVSECVHHVGEGFGVTQELQRTRYRFNDWLFRYIYGRVWSR